MVGRHASTAGKTHRRHQVALRRLAVIAGVILVAAAFAAATQVADTREGLVFEVVTLFAALAGVSLLLYGLVATLSGTRPVIPAPVAPRPGGEKVHNAAELLVGVSGLVVAALLLAGTAAAAGVMWVFLGAILLMPMIAGSAYLCFTFARGPRRDWKIDLQKLISQR